MVITPVEYADAYVGSLPAGRATRAMSRLLKIIHYRPFYYSSFDYGQPRIQDVYLIASK